ncbi:G2/M phase-specific E3 ubiquitin-protein ligase-like [Osmerus eperlanus]|uniref:G2/M phase-specific E3 ubiquitin-protein ligase-like n=1 Tax=Osmerus eperlanus TaxID=29151 RepID=UPI002E0D26A5
MSAIHSSDIFEGPDWEKSLSCNSQALYDGVYKQVGRMISVCLVHGGVEPQFFSERLYRQVCGLQPPVTDIAEINDYNFREKLTKVQIAQTVDEAHEAVLEASDELSMLGSVRYMQTLEERDALVESATKFYLESRLRDAVEQFKEGLECLSLLLIATRHPSLFREVFIHVEKPLLAKDLASLFVPELSPAGSNKRTVESRTICFWRDRLLEVEG